MCYRIRGTDLGKRTKESGCFFTEQEREPAGGSWATMSPGQTWNREKGGRQHQPVQGNRSRGRRGERKENRRARKKRREMRKS